MAKTLWNSTPLHVIARGGERDTHFQEEGCSFLVGRKPWVEGKTGWYFATGFPFK